MTKLLEKAFKETSKLSKIEQNSVAKWLLEELHSETKWTAAFADSEDILDKLADGAIKDKRKGKVSRLDICRL